MFFKKNRLTLLFILLICCATKSVAQQAQTYFGKNRVQYKTFEWQYISTVNFDIYFYEGGKEIARAAANYVENDFQQIVDKTGFTPYSKIKIIVYNTITDLQQSNIGIEDPFVLVGGQTHFVKSKMEVAFRGNQDEFRRDIRFGIAQMFVNIMLYGGSLKDIVQSSYLLALPDWYVNGAAAYIADGWSVEMDNFMRDYLSRKNVKKPSMLTGRDAVLVGQSIWNFIQENYGKGNVANILSLTRIVRNEEASVENSLGIPYSIFISNWKSYYQRMAESLKSEYVEQDPETKISKNGRGYKLKNLKVSPDGKKLAFVRTHKGRVSLIVKDVVSGRNKLVTKGGQMLHQGSEDPNAIIHAWKDANVLAYIENKNTKLWLNYYDINTRKRNKALLKNFSQVLSFSFSSDGEYAIFSADKSGQSDLFIFNVKDKSVKQLTNDLYDDLQPSFVKGGYSLVFSSNRLSDTLKAEGNSYKQIQSNFNVFVFNFLSDKKDVLQRLTKYGNNTRPQSLNKDEILFLSDEKGIRNIYKCNISNSEIHQLTKYFRNVDEFSFDQNTIALKSIYHGKDFIYLPKEFSLNASLNTAFTVRQKQYELQNPRVVVQSDSIVLEDKEIDINNYQFESEVKKNKEEAKEFQEAKPIARENQKYMSSSPYRNLFGIERVNSTIMIDPLRGLGVLMDVDMADMMGNHRMNAGIFGLSDLKSSNIFGEYQYLKKRIDFKIRYDRKTIFAFNEIANQRYTLNRLMAGAFYPFSTHARISVSPFVLTTRYTDLTNIFSKDNTVAYAGLRTEYVYDNTINTGLNMIEGSRVKVLMENYFTSNSDNRFGKFVLDLRHYQKIHRDLIFATRASLGQFFGKAQKNFLLGGMDNWLLNSTASHNGFDPLSIGIGQDNSNLLFVEYVTNMRGFNYNYQFGPKYVLFNEELRLPVFKYFYKGVINSNFLKNFQLAGFTDIGAAWSGKSPLNRDNSTNTTIVGGGSGPFQAKVVNYKNPFLIGFGAGVRTLFLGYYVKFDVAWGVVNGNVLPRKFYLTFGYDF